MVEPRPEERAAAAMDPARRPTGRVGSSRCLSFSYVRLTLQKQARQGWTRAFRSMRTVSVPRIKKDHRVLEEEMSVCPAKAITLQE
jgi:hypothetical protein